MGLGAIASCPVAIAYILTADHSKYAKFHSLALSLSNINTNILSRLTYGTIASSEVANRFRVFNEHAQDSSVEARRRRNIIREQIQKELC